MLVLGLGLEAPGCLPEDFYKLSRKRNRVQLAPNTTPLVSYYMDNVQVILEDRKRIKRLVTHHIDTRNSVSFDCVLNLETFIVITVASFYCLLFHGIPVSASSANML